MEKPISRKPFSIDQVQLDIREFAGRVPFFVGRDFARREP
jgi:hypothetical protein